MLLLKYKKGGGYMNNENGFVIDQGVIDECLNESLEKITR